MSSQNHETSAFIKSISKALTGTKNFLGLGDKSTPISFEISEFMQEVENSFEQLPQDYKKLYELTPCGADFFVNREKEMEKLKVAYEDWNKNRFVSCAIVAQKGAGVTSMINRFLATNSKIEIMRDEIGKKIYSKEDYFGYFNTLFCTEGISKNQDLINHINTKDEKIIILENLHHMFLKKVDGFAAIELLFELVSYTTKKVLWIASFTPETWKYLDKTILISNYFTSVLTIEPLSLESIKETIIKRNKSANLKMQFLQKEDQGEKDKKTQNSLEEHFFRQLFKLSDGNISLALLYMIKAIEKVDNKKIHLKQIDVLDSSFIHNISVETLFVLQILILHDGLTLQDYSMLTGESNQECRKKFMPMLEKGILIQPKQKYNINPAIYKHIHDYLLSKNYIH